MKSLFLALFCLLGSLAPAPAKGKTIELYASLISDTPVSLEDGARWLMEKGDAFPVLMFKEQQTKVILQLAGTRFTIPANRVRVFEGKAITPAMRATYQRNVENYTKSLEKKPSGDAEAKPES